MIFFQDSLYTVFYFFLQLIFFFEILYTQTYNKEKKYDEKKSQHKKKTMTEIADERNCKRKTIKEIARIKMKRKI